VLSGATGRGLRAVPKIGLWIQCGSIAPHARRIAPELLTRYSTLPAYTLEEHVHHYRQPRDVARWRRGAPGVGDPRIDCAKFRARGEGEHPGMNPDCAI